ncbi:MAG: acyl carrier protein [Thermodesulfobacteriota bacterium]
MSNAKLVNDLKDLLTDKFDLGVEKADLNESTSLIEYGLGVDSVSTMEFIVALEKKFGVEIDESEFDPSVLSTMNTLIVYISEKLKLA